LPKKIATLLKSALNQQKQLIITMKNGVYRSLKNKKEKEKING
jgi:hypothetical protein